MDNNTAKLKKNAFRVTKERGLTASRVRVPGGHLEAKYPGVLQHIAEEYGNGTVHISSRQGFEIPGIPFDKMDEVNAALQSIIEGLQINQEAENEGYPAAGTRNITACIGNRVCPYACYDTTAFAKRIEKAVFPNDLHFKIALTGCPNDCGKVRLHDFGIMGMTEPQLDPDRCVSCGACVKKCEKKSVGALKLQKRRGNLPDKGVILMIDGCQGKPRTPTIIEKICPQCGAEIELFSIDTQMACEKCGFIAYNDTLSCVQWYAFARKCVGDEMYEHMMELAAAQRVRA